jgi:hypothetical protein
VTKSPTPSQPPVQFDAELTRGGYRTWVDRFDADHYRQVLTKAGIAVIRLEDYDGGDVGAVGDVRGWLATLAARSACCVRAAKTQESSSGQLSD